MTLAWNPVNPRIFAAGYDHVSMNDSSLMIWDIEQDMNQYLNRVKIEDEQQFLGVAPHHQHSPRGDVDLQAHFVALGKVETTESPKIITDCHQAFQNITDDIYSIAWLPESEFELIYATENQIQFCDTRQSFNKKTIVAMEN